MRKTFLLAALVAALAAWSAASASATVHPIVCSEKSAAPNWTPAQTQNPPGITDGADPDPDNNVEARPIVAQLTNSTLSDFASWKPEGC
jgi:hypothetical protein